LPPSGVTRTLTNMGWTLDGNSPIRDVSVSVEDEVAAAFAEQPIPWRHKFVRLWRAITRR